jgi:hypothetical protein
VMIISVHGAGGQHGIAVCGLCTYGRGGLVTMNIS